MSLPAFRTSFFIFLLLFTMVSCTKKPEACMGFSMEQAEIGKELKFNNCSKNSESVTWRFGDGNITESENPSYSYKKIGEYQVDLLAYSKNFKYQDKASTNIRIGEKRVLKIVLKEYPFNSPSADIVVKVGNSHNNYLYTSPTFSSVTYNSLPLVVDISSTDIRASLETLAVLFISNTQSNMHTVKLSEAEENPYVVKRSTWHFDIHYELVFK